MGDIATRGEDIAAVTTAEVASRGRGPLSVAQLRRALGRTLRGAELVLGDRTGTAWIRSDGELVHVAAENPTVIVNSIPLLEVFTAVFAGQRTAIHVDVDGAGSREIVVRVEVGDSSSLHRVVKSLLPVLGEMVIREWAPEYCGTRILDGPDREHQPDWWHWQADDQLEGSFGVRRIARVDTTTSNGLDSADPRVTPLDRTYSAAVSSALVSYFGKGETKTPSPSVGRVRRDHLDWETLVPAVEAIIRSSISVPFLADEDLAASTRRATAAYRMAFPDLSDEAIASLAWAWAWENR